MPIVASILSSKPVEIIVNIAEDLDDADCPGTCTLRAAVVAAFKLCAGSNPRCDVVLDANPVVTSPFATLIGGMNSDAKTGGPFGFRIRSASGRPRTITYNGSPGTSFISVRIFGGMGTGEKDDLSISMENLNLVSAEGTTVVSVSVEYMFPAFDTVVKLTNSTARSAGNGTLIKVGSSYSEPASGSISVSLAGVETSGYATVADVYGARGLTTFLETRDSCFTGGTFSFGSHAYLVPLSAIFSNTTFDGNASFDLSLYFAEFNDCTFRSQPISIMTSTPYGMPMMTTNLNVSRCIFEGDADIAMSVFGSGMGLLTVVDSEFKAAAQLRLTGSSGVLSSSMSTSGSRFASSANLTVDGGARPATLGIERNAFGGSCKGACDGGRVAYVCRPSAHWSSHGNVTSTCTTNGTSCAVECWRETGSRQFDVVV
eukprot:TRINITY_DN3248_c0_g1_i2.p1 TRINITY_DN3248_c0_g1~~TRINITY_DN3248_c0_g1_i2.p1  ORF type:complete len:467 (-),score=46.64 TRINITY_DN3248_c0_g1_i2:31-1317(-)